MGQWLSARLDYSIVSEGDTVADSPDGTPKDNKRILNIDPRSPTAGLNRTPIEVNSTPKAGDGSAVENASPLTTAMPAGGGRPRTLHQRIMDKRKKEVEA
ncbi:hypothetical protein GCK32_017198 [Trichostrongylus colubriformis]|uniref:Uncharacterized protein n=1 Tax=Trichostrongylus colubriformis TaxID=6319 RepID=A0AAN8GA96_TRICO